MLNPPDKDVARTWEGFDLVVLRCLSVGRATASFAGWLVGWFHFCFAVSSVRSGRTDSTDTTDADVEDEDNARELPRTPAGGRCSDDDDETEDDGGNDARIAPAPPAEPRSSATAADGRSSSSKGATGASTLLAPQEIGGVMHANAGRLDVLEVRI